MFSFTGVNADKYTSSLSPSKGFLYSPKILEDDSIGAYRPLLEFIFNYPRKYKQSL